MGNYLKAELYKVCRRKYLWITLAVTLGLEILLVLGYLTISISGSSMSAAKGVTNLLVLLSLGFYATVLTGDMVFADQYKNATLKNEVSYGVPRSRIYLGKLLAQLTVAVLLCAAVVGVYLGLCLLTQTRDRAADAAALASVGYGLAAALPLWVGVQGLSCALYFLISNSTWSAVVTVGTVSVLPYLIYFAALILQGSGGNLGGDALMAVYKNMPATLLETAVERAGDWALCGRAWLVGAAWLAASTAAGLFGFCRREIR